MYVCIYWVNQHLIILNLDSDSIHKVLATELITVKVKSKFDIRYVNTEKSTT